MLHKKKKRLGKQNLLNQDLCLQRKTFAIILCSQSLKKLFSRSPTEKDKGMVAFQRLSWNNRGCTTPNFTGLDS